MKVIRDHRGLPVRLTDERFAHILEHPEMAQLEGSIAETLTTPGQVVQSLTDPRARLYYRFYAATPVSGKHLCVVVKRLDEDAFVVTAYLTDRVKRGVQLWPETE